MPSRLTSDTRPVQCSAVGLSRDEAKQRVRAAGLRATAPRIAVLRLLAATDRPLAHSDVVEEIGTDDWDQATLYRNLVKLVEAGLARVVSTAGGVTRYGPSAGDHDTHDHPHFACRTCGGVECLPEAELTGAVSRRWRRSVANSELQLVGDCPDCLAAAKKTLPAKRR